MDPLNPIRPTVPTPPVKPAPGKVKRREPGTGGDLEKQDNQSPERRKPASGDHQVDELV